MIRLPAFFAAASLAWVVAADTQAISLRITVENLAPANSVATAPLRFGFGNGTFDAFNNNETAFLLGAGDIADAPIVTIAEGGSGSAWFPAFAAAEPNADLGSVISQPSGNFPSGGPFVPGDVSSTIIDVDPANQFFTFGTMVVPSNDHFLGNDSPTAFQVFDGAGNLILDEINQLASQIWDAGSETENPANAAFLPGIGINAQRENENEPVTFNFADLSAFDGLATAGGYTFDSSLLTADTPVLRISFAVVPEPSSYLLALSAGAVGVVIWRRRR